MSDQNAPISPMIEPRASSPGAQAQHKPAADHRDRARKAEPIRQAIRAGNQRQRNHQPKRGFVRHAQQSCRAVAGKTAKRPADQPLEGKGKDNLPVADKAVLARGKAEHDLE
jgi:hypothetical protein